MAVCHGHTGPYAGSFPVTWAAPYVGKPFELGARGPTAFDCWGLVRSIYNDILDIELPGYGEIDASDLRRVTRQMIAGRDAEPWKMVLEPQEFDVVVMGRYTSRFPGHVGIMIDDHRVLHTEQSCNACVVSFNNPSVRERILGFRRHVTRL